MNKDKTILKTLLLGSFFASLSAMLGGSTFVFTRYVVDSIDPYTLSFLRYGLTGLILFLLSISVYMNKKFAKADLIPMCFLGLAMITLFPNFMALGLEHTTAARAGLLYATMPLCTIIIAYFFNIEKITLNKSLAVLLAILGVSFCMSERVDNNFQDTLKGDFLMMIGVLSASCFTVFSGKYLKKYGNIPVMIFVILIGTILNLIISMIFGNSIISLLEINKFEAAALLMLIIPGGVVMMYCWGKALQLISPTQAAISLGFNPLTAILLGSIILNEEITFKLGIGFISILMAIILANWKSKIKA
ncbi:MAG: DMT family transporter [Candidatus Puniceispirillales bacterium]|jgi:drug/metabolite transporter (DMT)-like permease|tara:strand:+ start:744 stop:1655 length:912 start_codon:yes stop_codon:yes gene_type:complete